LAAPPPHQKFDARRTLANWAVVDLTRTNGIGLAAVMNFLSEIPNPSRFETVKQFCSWLGLSPGTKISGGKVLSAKAKRSANCVRRPLKMAAMSLSHSDCHGQAQREHHHHAQTRANAVLRPHPRRPSSTKASNATKNRDGRAASPPTSAEPQRSASRSI
jgi:transposase